MRSWVPILTLFSIAPGVIGVLPRWRFDLDRRQDITSAPDPFATTEPAASTDVFLTTPLTTPDPTTPGPTTPDPTTPALATETTPLLTTEVTPTTSTPTSTSIAVQTTQSSVPLLFTQSSTTSTRPSFTPTATPTAVSDTNVPFSKSKYHQMIIALGCLAGALLIALVGTAIVAFRARADVDLLRDRLSRYEEEFDMSQRKRDSSHSLGYGRVSMSDPDDPRKFRSRRSMSDGRIDPRSAQGGMPKSDRRQSMGDRRVSFGTDAHSDGSPLLSHERGRRDSAPPPVGTRPLMLAKKSDNSVPARVSAPHMISSPTQIHGPRQPVSPPHQLMSSLHRPISPPRPLGQTSGPRPNPGTRRISLQDPGPVPAYSPPSQVRRLPATPGASSRGSSTSTYVDPFNSSGGGYPAK